MTRTIVDLERALFVLQLDERIWPRSTFNTQREPKQDSNKLDTTPAIPKHQREMFPIAVVPSRENC